MVAFFIFRLNVKELPHDLLLVSSSLSFLTGSMITTSLLNVGKRGLHAILRLGTERLQLLVKVLEHKAPLHYYIDFIRLIVTVHGSAFLLVSREHLPALLDLGVGERVEDLSGSTLAH